jgi:hypothetical protein
VPPNLRFIVDDCEDDWLDTTPYDYIHARYLTASLLDWPKFARRMYEYVSLPYFAYLLRPQLRPLSLRPQATLSYTHLSPRPLPICAHCSQIIYLSSSLPAHLALPPSLILEFRQFIRFLVTDNLGII